MKPIKFLLSTESNTAFVPTKLAITPPRSISPIIIVGIDNFVANPIFAISPSRRLISAGLPAPSTKIRSCLADKFKKAFSTYGISEPLIFWYSNPLTDLSNLPLIISCDPLSLCGLRSIGLCKILGSSPDAIACIACALPISPPSKVAAALFDIFCGLNGATDIPFLLNRRHSPATIIDLPTLEPVP